MLQYCAYQAFKQKLLVTESLCYWLNNDEFKPYKEVLITVACNRAPSLIFAPFCSLCNRRELVGIV